MIFAKQKESIPEMDIKIVSQIRSLGLDMIQNAKSGHPGITLGAAPILYTLYSKHLKINPKDPSWINRDRFVMSAGHGSALLYSTLYLAGYNIELDDLKNFRKIDSITPGHPEYGVTPGVDASTGPLGQGVGMAVGMAIAEEYLRKTLKDNNEPIVSYNTYCLVGDGDLMEGINYEALSLAGTLKLNKLIILYDNNNNSLDGNISITFTEDVSKRMEAFGFNVIEVNDGEDLLAIDHAIEKAKESEKPTFISIKTTIGKYSKLEGTNLVHGKILDEDDVLEIKRKLNVREIPFTVSSEVVEHFQNEISTRIEKEYNQFNELLEKSENKTIINRLINKEYSLSLKNLDISIDEISDKSLRNLSSKIINSVDDPLFIGGSCDLFTSCKTYQKEKGDFSNKSREGKNLWFGVREHASGAIINGLALSGLRPYTSTFLSFSDYMKPAIRMSALMNLPVIYIFTHDSVTVGEDGPTHQPIEQLDMLRLIPNVEVYRPADMNEVIGTYKTILSKNEGVSVIVLSRNEVEQLTTTSINEVAKGAYIVSREESTLQGILISSGEDLQTAMELKRRLLTKGIETRVVSMTSIERFTKMDKEYQEEILPTNIKKVAIEASTGLSYLPFVENKNRLINIEKFGYSGSKEEVLKKLEFDIDSIENIKNL